LPHCWSNPSGARPGTRFTACGEPRKNTSCPGPPLCPVYSRAYTD